MSCPNLLVRILEEPGAGATVLAEPGGVVLTISPERLRARSALLALIEALDEGSPGGSYLLGDEPRDARAFALEQAWQSLRLWDFEHVVARLLGAAPRAQRLLFPGRSCLRYFSGRGALRAALGVRAARGGVSAEVCSLAYWASPGFGYLLDLEGCPASIRPAPRSWWCRRRAAFSGPSPRCPLRRGGECSANLRATSSTSARRGGSKRR